MAAPFDPITPSTRAASLVAHLAATNKTVATCESLTAGLVAAIIGGVPGASAVLRGGLVTYATDVKGLIANVPATVLDTYGPVSKQCAIAMAEGAAAACEADYAVALTGVAGPATHDGHPVGLVWCAVSGEGGSYVTKLQCDAEKGRWGIRYEAACAAIEFLFTVSGGAGTNSDG